jgi:hypothetical protein
MRRTLPRRARVGKPAILVAGTFPEHNRNMAAAFSPRRTRRARRLQHEPTDSVFEQAHVEVDEQAERDV